MNTSDPYCDSILKGKVPITIIHESDQVLAFEHTHPYWTTHLVVIPKRHIDSLAHASHHDREIISEMFEVSSKICRDLEARFGGCRLSTNIGNYQSSKHLHFYIHSGERLRNEDGSQVEST
jgi:histidine triad (HIT) family protein